MSMDTELDHEFNKIAHRISDIPGHMMPGQEKMLFALVKYLPKDATILEIGSFKGRSTVSMGYGCVGTQRRIFCIDTFDGNDSDFSDRNFFEEWRANVACNGLTDYITPLPGTSSDVLGNWKDLTNNAALDFVFIDGSHQFEDVLNDFMLVYPLLKIGGICAFHDVVPPWPGPYKLWNDFASLILEDHIIYLSLACGRKTGEMPRWARIYLDKLQTS